ncbi:MAG: LacI family DNA-binding transcriptional regulator [Klebsiella huaxiensis]|uniref:LacI family DNA-binding transcriptional regulator n=1 Tax=Klebsiella TaxID=570 RepID=UPI0026F0BAE0|nr:LacI family DNA-binding transcriptional regulator [Klebsiella huaxiensis]WEJ90623.1 MAG: LacI family DNA-binding transcriptional regulator [Klebsiella huaxiensis]
MQTLQADDGAKEKRRKNTGKITLAEVAKLVGVSTMTVSRALRMPEKVNPELRTRIEAAVSELGYVPNLQARSLASADSTLVMGVVPSFSSPGFIAASETLQTVLASRGYTMMFIESGQGGQSEEKAFQQMLAYNPAAIVQFNIDNIDSCAQMLINAGIPVVEIGAINHETTGVSIGVDYSAALKKLVTSLAQAGYKNLGLLCTASNNMMFRQVLSGWNSGMLSINYSPHRVVTPHLPSGITTGFNLLNDIRITWPELDALICTSDELACGCIMACHNAGIKVPDTLALASLSGGTLAAVCSPALTAVEFPWSEAGTIAGKTLLDLLAGNTLESAIELPSSLKVRASSRKPQR